MLKKKQNDNAGMRYMATIAQYRRAMVQNPALTLNAYCKMRHVYYRGLLEWMRKEGIDKPVHKTGGALKGSRSPASESYPRYDMGEVFIQIYPDEYLLRLHEGRK